MGKMVEHELLAELAPGPHLRVEDGLIETDVDGRRPTRLSIIFRKRDPASAPRLYWTPRICLHRSPEGEFAKFKAAEVHATG